METIMTQLYQFKLISDNLKEFQESRTDYLHMFQRYIIQRALAQFIDHRHMQHKKMEFEIFKLPLKIKL